jgi:serine/threonine protein kinase/cytochrome c-type biogenesis protein CcmH/NrfG
MTNIQLHARDIFLAAIELPSQEERAEFVSRECHENQELQFAVQRLLASHRELGPFCESRDAQFSEDRTALLEVGQQPVGTQIGPYKLREQLGEGGMGVVYVAEQTEPVKRKVALKIIKPGMASRDVVARFEAERQALAMMDHPNIAKVYDGGATESGQPYFVMELVQGLPITEYCDEHQLTTDQRLRLFATVCRAVQHAHQKGIIHRDLKPSNIIVSEIDDTAIPKVIDFGVAKAVGQTLTEETVYTHFSQMVGTPLYMSPEQTGLGVVDIDTRSDVYSLAVMLYELLTGSTPFDSDTLKAAGFDEMRRIIREEEPPKPSAMVSTLNAEALSTVSQRRGAEPRRLSEHLSGELDWLVMKALEKDRNRRYESASALAADVDRYLGQQPMIAGPPSLAYRFSKYAQRNKAKLIAASLAFSVLLIGVISAGGAALQAQQERRELTQAVEQSLAEARTAIEAGDLALARRKVKLAQSSLFQLRSELTQLSEAADALQAEVEARREEASRFLSFVTIAENALAGSGDNVDEKREALLLYDALSNDQWTAKLDAGYLDNQQRNQVRETAYELLLSLSDYAIRRSRDVALALEHLERAQAFHEPTKALFWVRAACHRDNGDQEIAARDERLFDATPAISPLDCYFPAEEARQEGDYERAIAGYEAALRVEPAHFNSLRNMARCLEQLDRYADASIALRSCLALKPDNDTTLRMAASVFAQAGKYEDALAANQRLLDQDPGDFWPIVIEGRIREMQGDYDRARATYDALIELFATEDRYAADREANTAQAYDQRGVLAYRWMQFDQSLTDLDQAIALRSRTVHFHRHRADALAALGRSKEAVAAIERAIALYETADQQDDSMLADLLSQQASLLDKAERCDEALEHFTQAMELAPQNADVLRRFAYFRANSRDESVRRPDEAVALARQAVELSRDPATEYVLALAELRSGDLPAAIKAAEEPLAERMPGPEQASAYFVSAMAHSQLGNEAAAREAYDAGSGWLGDRGAAEDLYGLRSEAEASLSESLQSPSEPVESEADANSR